MEPAVVSFHRILGPLAALFKHLVRKSIRWYVHPQVAALEQELARVREELTQLEKQHVQTQAFALNHYQELFSRLERLEADQTAARSAAAKAA
jgi:DNA topoisomerase IB